jgi:uncharacterized DUF497 family protein
MVEGPLFEWDDRKAAENVARGRPPFEDVLRFDFTSTMIADDGRWDYGEQRIQAIGMIDGRAHFLVYTERNDRRRIISLRKANKREVSLYDRYTQIGDR